MNDSGVNSQRGTESAAAVLAHAHQNGGFLNDRTIQVLARDPTTRLTQCLVRCGGARFTAPAQDVEHLIAIIEADGRDYVRDVSIAR